MTENAATSFEGLLSKFAAFRELDSERLRWLSERARPYHCTVGQELLRRDRMPEYCFCVVEDAVACFMTTRFASTGRLAYAHPETWLVGLVGAPFPL